MDRPRKFPAWFVAAGYSLPARFELTLHATGYVKSVGGRTRWVCGKVSPREAREAWYAKRAALIRAAPASKPRPQAGTMTVLELTRRFMTWMHGRLTTGKPKRLKMRTYKDYIDVIQAFADTPLGDGRRMADLPVVDLLGDSGPEYFGKYGARIPGQSPYTRARHMAYIQAMFAWAGPGKKGMHYLPTPPFYGPDFQKPQRQEMRTARAALDKAWTPAEFRAAVKAAKGNGPMTCFLWLGATCAFTEADIAELPVEAVDLQAKVIDFARAKTGEFRRCPMVPPLLKAMKAYQRPENAKPEAEGLFFVTRHGRPYARMKEKRDDAGTVVGATPIRTISQLTGRLMDAAKVKRGGRGHAGLRTMFRELADTHPDERAIDVVMGHKSGEMKKISAEYVQANRVPLRRLEAVTQHVYKRLVSE